MNIKSISTKILLTLILTIVLTSSFFLYLFMYSSRTENLRRINSEGTKVMSRLLTVSSMLYSANESSETRIKYAEQFFNNEVEANSFIQSIALYATDKSLKLYIGRDDKWKPIRLEEEPQFQYDPRIVNILKEDIIFDSQKMGSLEVILSDKIARKGRFSKFNDMLFTLMFSIIFSSLIIFIFLQLAVIHPLKTLIKYVQQYRKSGYASVTLVPSSSSEDEIGLLIQEFNDLMADLTKSFDYKAFLIRQLELSNEEMQKEVKERIYAEECERSAQGYMNTVFNLVPAMLAVVDEELMITQINEQLRNFIGVDSDFVKTPLSTILPFTENLANLIFNCLKERKIQTFQCSYKDKYYKLTINPFEYRNGVCGIIRLDDVTNSIIKENEIFDSFQLEDTKRLISNITHNFNNLLGGIIGAVFLAKLELKELPGENSELKEMLNIIETAAQRSSSLIKKLSFISNWDEGTVSEVDLHELIDNILSILSSSIPSEIKVCFNDNLHGEKALIQGNIRQLEQIFLGLILNAVNSMTILRKNGEIWHGELRINLSKEISGDSNDYYCIEIQDDGIGLDENQLKDILDSQNIDNTDKTFGFVICKNLIKRHNGWLNIDSEINKGSTFQVCLPITEYNKNIEDSEKMPIPQTTEKTILVIDDNEMLLKVAGQMLNKCGYKVLTADNGTDGIKIFRNNKQIVLVLLDLLMPDLSGLEVFKQLREYRSDIAVIFMSGGNEKRELAGCEGYDGFLTKPYSLNELSHKVFEVLKKNNL